MAETTDQFDGFQLQFGFKTNEGLDDVEIVLQFLEDLPDFLYMFFLEFQPNATVFGNYFKWGSGTRDLMDDAFREAKDALEKSIRQIRFSIEDDEDEHTILFIRLKRIGFTGSSLELKATLLKDYWERLQTSIRKTGNFFSAKTMGLVLSVLKLINSYLDSIKSVIPGVDAIKEFKEYGESVLTIPNEMIDVTIEDPDEKKPFGNRGGDLDF